MNTSAEPDTATVASAENADGTDDEPPESEAASELASVAGELVLPTGSILLIAGIPGAGKSTLIQRLFDPNAPRSAGWPVVLDSAQIRTALARRFGTWMPYALYRPVVHTTHYARIAARTVGPMRTLVVHECGTRDWARRTIAILARLRRRPAHLLFLDTAPAVALAGQRARGRVIPRRSFRRHQHSWARMRQAIGDRTLLREGWQSARGITRAEATCLEIRFEKIRSAGARRDTVRRTVPGG